MGEQEIGTTGDAFLDRRRELRERGNSVVRVPIGRLDKEIGKVHKGKSKRYTVKKMLNAINRYFEQCETRDVIPTIKGLTMFLKLSPGMFYTYKEYPEFSDLMEAAWIMISDWIERDIYNTPGQASGKIKFAMNVLGWADKLETTNETKPKTVMNTASAAILIQELAPDLLELLDSARAVDSMGGVEDAEFIEEKK